MKFLILHRWSDGETLYVKPEAIAVLVKADIGAQLPGTRIFLMGDPDYICVSESPAKVLSMIKCLTVKQKRR